MDNLYANVPRDLTRVKSKLFLNLTKRQILCFGAAILVGLPLFFLIRKTGNMTLAAMTMILVMLPFFFLAMYEKDGMPLEVILDHFFEAKFRRPKERPYVTNNYYSVLIRQYEAEKEVDEIVLHEERKAKGKRRAESSKVSQQKRP